MSAGKRFLTFLSGSVLGAAVGTAAAVLWAPRSGTEMRGRLIDRIRQARLAGAEAKAAKEDELIQKFRQDVEDPAALRDEEAKRRVEAAQAVAAIGLSLNAPGAIAAQEAALRRADAASATPIAPAPAAGSKRGP
ncbi:MAG: YtxH domain-containing protein [Chloroflexota bacterium]|nr:YtxH domain-containing protein [Chloroflexota bacterium]